MAQGKKSFIAYSDWQDTFEALPDDKAGMLIKHIFKYVNDENPEADDLLVNAVFQNIRNTLKRDLEKWDKQYKQRVKAGQKSAEVRKQNAATVNDRSTKTNDRSISSTVSVNGSVSDNVNVTVNDNVIQMEVYRKFAHLQISFIEFDKLNAIYSKEKIDDCLDAIENYKKNTGYKSLFLTAKKWLKKDEETNTQKNDGKKFQYKFDVAEITRQAQNGELKR